jgi:hypothetical protein
MEGDFMKSLIKKVKLSKSKAVIGESIRVDVETSDSAAEVTVNKVGGATHYLQFDKAGSRTIVVAATLGKRIEQVARKVEIRDRPPDAPAIPLIGSAMDRYRPRTVVFSIRNADIESANVRGYNWDFGDGTRGTSDAGNISHDYSAGLSRDSLFTAFHVRVTVRRDDGTEVDATRTVAVFCVYGYNKIRRGLLTPLVEVLEPVTLPLLGVLCLFTVHNLEDEELSFTAEQHEWLSTESGEPRVSTGLSPGIVSHAAITAVTAIRAQIPLDRAPVLAPVLAAQLTPAPAAQAAWQLAAGATPAMDVRVPARSSVTMARVFSTAEFKKPFFGVAIHFKGTGVCSERPAVASAYVEVRLPLELGGNVISPRALQSLGRAGLLDRGRLTHADLREFAGGDGPPPEPDEFQVVPTGRTVVKPRTDEGLPGSVAAEPLLIRLPTQVAASVHDLLTPHIVPLDRSDIVLGSECDPDNLPDDLPEGTVCQLTGETAWRFVPGRVLNAKKGDVILSPSGSGIIGQLLRQVSPTQYYSHSGIMTKNHIEIRHSTASDDWLRDHPRGGGKTTEGFEPAALKYLWPGTITQTIDQACYFQWLTSPDKGPYKIQAFSFDPDTGNPDTLTYPLVVKPPPFEETPQVRLSLHAIADAALGINGHYRFYCYTNPAIALDPGSLAGPEAGWAQGTWPTVCSSTIWLAAQHARIRLEGPNPTTPVSDLEPSDTKGGAEVDQTTQDGLYHYTAEERRAAARWLYQYIYDQAYSSAGFFGTLFTDAPDDVASQICNTFASDWADGDSKDSDAWQHTESANAVSPDNILFWDSPGPGNQHQFRSVYGHMEELFYRPGTFQQVPIYRWRHVATRGTLTGRVVANGDVAGANVSLVGSGKPDVVVGSDGRFEFTQVPTGSYTVSAGLNIGGYWNSAAPTVQIDAGTTTDVTVMLQTPPAVHRLVTISVDMETDWKSIWAHGPHYHSETKFAKVHPFHSHERLEFEGSDLPHGKAIFDIDLNPDLSVTVSWTAQEIDDEMEGEVKGGHTIPQDGSLNWNGLRVVNDDPIDADWTTMSFTIHNDLATA